jgi:hypothetical protein
MAKKLAKATAKEAVKETPKEEAVVEQEALVTEDAPAEVAPATIIDGSEFAYEIKAGKGTFPNMSAEAVMEFVDATLGNVDKIVITRNA